MKSILNKLMNWIAPCPPMPPCIDIPKEPLKPVNEFCQPPSQSDLEDLWRMVITQDTPEMEESFTINFLRGAIKIPKQVIARVQKPLRIEHIDSLEEMIELDKQLGGGAGFWGDIKNRVPYRKAARAYLNLQKGLGNDEAKFLIREILHSLPSNRDWLNPDIERQAWEYIKELVS